MVLLLALWHCCFFFLCHSFSTVIAVYTSLNSHLTTWASCSTSRHLVFRGRSSSRGGSPITITPCTTLLCVCVCVYVCVCVCVCVCVSWPWFFSVGKCLTCSVAAHLSLNVFLTNCFIYFTDYSLAVATLVEICFCVIYLISNICLFIYTRTIPKCTQSLVSLFCSHYTVDQFTSYWYVRAKKLSTGPLSYESLFLGNY